MAGPSSAYNFLFLVLALLAFCMVRVAGEPEEIIAASFEDAGCTVSKFMARPQSLRGGECVLSYQYQFYYTISNPSDNIAQFRYGCAEGCAPSNCSFVGSADFGSCVRINITIPNSNSTTNKTRATRNSFAPEGIHPANDTTAVIYASAWRVETNASLAFQIYNDNKCAMMRPYGRYHVDSALCTYSKLINSSFMVSYLDQRDAPEAERVAYRVNCNQDCSSCALYSRTAIDQCIQIDNAWVKIMLGGASPDQGLPTWELVVIIACAAGGGIMIALIGLTVTFLVCRNIKRKRTVYRAIN